MNLFSGVKAFCALFATGFGLVAYSATPTVTSVTAQQRYPWNGFVDIVVTLQGSAEDVALIDCKFSAVNSATKAALPVAGITQSGNDFGSGTSWSRHFIWDAAKDVGAIRIDDVALTVGLTSGVQLWEGGPYWAKCNVGAKKPEEYGYYFWWGDTVGCKRNAANDGWISVKGGAQFEFHASNCPTEGLNGSALRSAGYTDSSGRFVASYDAATVHLGAPWRIPTNGDFGALISNCKSARTTRNGVSGWLFRGKGTYASKSIFFPAAGYGNWTSFVLTHSSGYYLSSSPHSVEYPNGIYNSYAVWVLHFNSSNIYYPSKHPRCLGQSVRPLRESSNGSTCPTEVGVTTHLVLDCRTGTRMAHMTEQIRFSPAWATDAAGATATVCANGVAVRTATEAGVFNWMPTHDGIYRFTHTATVNGIQVGETLSAIFVVGDVITLNPPVVNEQDASINLTWSMDYSSDNLLFDVYRSTSADFSTASVVGTNIGEKTFKDETWLQTFSNEDTLYYWVVAKDGDYEIGRSDEKSADLAAVRIPVAPAASDVLFVASSPAGYKPANGGVAVEIPIGRYFGDANRLVKSGAMASQVVLEVMQTKDIPVDASVVLNGVPLAGGYNCSTSATDGERWNRVRYSVDVGALKLPENKGTEVANTVKIVFDEGTGRETVAWAALYIPVAPPVVLAHGINSSASQLGKLKDEIEWLGIPTVSGNFDNNGNNAISDIADLTRLVDQAKRDFGVETVNIVGHSMGGLRAREYVQKHKQTKDVMKVLQVASPNGGSPVADFVFNLRLSYYDSYRKKGLWRPSFPEWEVRGVEALRELARDAGLAIDPWHDAAMISLMTSSMIYYNQRNPLLTDVDYGVVAGHVTSGLGGSALKHSTISSWLVSGWYDAELRKLGRDMESYVRDGLAPLLHSLGESDGVVPVASAFTLVPPLGPALTGTADEVWHSGLISNGVKRTMALLTPKLIDHKTCEYGEDVASRKMLKARQSLFAAGSQADNGANESLIVSSTNGMSLVSGVLDPNTNYAVSVGVCAGNLSVFAFQQTGTCIDMDRVELYDPSGRRVVENKDVFMTNDAACVFCVLRNPIVGNWQLKFSTGDCDGEDMWTLAFHEVDSPVVVKVELAKSEIVVGEAFELTVCAKNGNSPLYGTVDVTMTSPSGEYSRKVATSIGGGRYRCNLVAKRIGDYAFGVQFNTTNPLAISRLLSFGACAVEGSSGNKITYLSGEQCDGEPVVQEKPSGVAVKLRGPTFLRESYLQVGWIDSTGSGQTYAFGEYFTNDVDLTLLPVWKQRQDAVSQALGFDEGSIEISGDGQWFPEFGGGVVRGSILSGRDSTETSMSATVDGGGVFSFMIKTSCESSLGAADRLRDHAEFLVDGEIVATSDGESTWKQVSVNLSGGKSHTVTWRYVKDGSGSAGEDCVWVSDIQFAALADEETSDELLDESEYNWFYEDAPVRATPGNPFEYNPSVAPERATCQIDVQIDIGVLPRSALQDAILEGVQACICRVEDAVGFEYAVVTSDGWEMVGNADLALDADEDVKVSIVMDYTTTPSTIKYMISGHTLTNAEGVSTFVCAAQKTHVESLLTKGSCDIDSWAGKYDVANADVQQVAPGAESGLTADLDTFPNETFQVSGGGTLVIPSDRIPVGGVNRKLHVDGNSTVKFDLSGLDAIPSVTRLFNGVGGSFVIGDNIQLVVPGEGVERVSKLFVKDGNLEARVAERPAFDDGDGSDSAFAVNVEGGSSAVSASIGNAVEGFWYGLLTAGVLTSDFVLDPDSVKQCPGTGSLRLESSANANSASGFYRVSVSAEKP